MSDFGRAFYKRPVKAGKIVRLEKVEGGKPVDEKYAQGDNELVPFWTGKRLNWEIVQS